MNSRNGVFALQADWNGNIRIRRFKEWKGIFPLHRKMGVGCRGPNIRMPSAFSERRWRCPAGQSRILPSTAGQNSTAETPLRSNSSRIWRRCSLELRTRPLVSKVTDSFTVCCENIIGLDSSGADAVPRRSHSRTTVIARSPSTFGWMRRPAM